MFVLFAYQTCIHGCSHWLAINHAFVLVLYSENGGIEVLIVVAVPSLTTAYFSSFVQKCIAHISSDFNTLRCYSVTEINSGNDNDCVT